MSRSNAYARGRAGLLAYDAERPIGVPAFAALPSTVRRRVLAMVLRPGDRGARDRALYELRAHLTGLGAP